MSYYCTHCDGTDHPTGNCPYYQYASRYTARQARQDEEREHNEALRKAIRATSGQSSTTWGSWIPMGDGYRTRYRDDEQYFEVDCTRHIFFTYKEQFRADQHGENSSMAWMLKHNREHHR